MDRVGPVTSARNADVIVVGLGAMGSATAHHLAGRGASVLAFDQYSPPHELGSTHGDTRITRLAIGEGLEFVPLVRRSHELWRELERETATQLLTQCGGLILGRPGDPFVAQTRQAALDYGIAHENLSHGEIAARYPMFALETEVEGYYEPESGYLRPEEGVRAQLERARALGAQLRFGERVNSWAASANGVSVQTDTGAYTGGQLVLCVGPWIETLLSERRTFAVYRQLLFWFAIRERYEQLSAMPAFVWVFGREQQDFRHFDGIYGFPAIDGPSGGVKLATERYEQTTAPDGRQHPATPGEVGEMYERLVGPRLPWIGPTPVRTVSCLYTCTRNSTFVIDRHPEHDAVVIVSACSGHGFKHSPAIGEAVAQLVTAGSSDVDLGPFTLARARK
jgi:sarcosine oxidase